MPLHQSALGTRPIANRSRLKILYALSHDQELCVCDIATLLNVKVATASHHRRKLRDLKILKYRNDGKLAYYSLRDRQASDIFNYSLKQVVDWGFERVVTVKCSGGK